MYVTFIEWKVFFQKTATHLINLEVYVKLYFGFLNVQSINSTINKIQNNKFKLVNESE